MPRIIVGSYVACYPVGGFLSWTIQWLVGLHRLGHEVYLVEKSGSWPNPCFNLSTGRMDEDFSFGVTAVEGLLARFGLTERFCFVDRARRYHGMSRERIESLFRTADLFLDMSGGLILPVTDTWLPEADASALRVCVDGEPGYSQMRMEGKIEDGDLLTPYDCYYTVGLNAGTERSTVPTAGKSWHHVFDPVNVDLYPDRPVRRDAPFTTIMAWQSHKPVEYKGRSYGQKDVEFDKFKDLPRLTNVPLEIALNGQGAPIDQLQCRGWVVRDSHAVTVSFDSFNQYIQASRGEFTVCKHVFVETQSGWFSDRSAVYLANARPVVMQDTGFSSHLPCGEGLFAVRSADQAAAAIDAICGDYERHSAKARELASEYLDAGKVLPRFLSELGL